MPRDNKDFMLLIARSKGPTYGPELITNGDFPANVVGWSAFAGLGTVSWDAGQLRFTTDGNPGAGAEQAGISIVNGASYLFTATMSPGNTPDKARITWAAGFAGTVSWDFDINGGTVNAVLVANATSATVRLHVANSGAWGANLDFSRFDNISLKRIL